MKEPRSRKEAVMSIRTRGLNLATVALGTLVLTAAASMAAAQDASPPSPSDGSTCDLEERNIRMERVSYVPFRTATSSNLRASCTSK
jgi:hypothetical protein